MLAPFFMRRFPAITSVLPLLFWMGFIFFLSTNAGSAEHTNSFSDSLLLKFFPGLARHLTFAQLDALHFYLRKAAHLTEYAILGVLFSRAGQSFQVSRFVAFAWILATLYAVTDEFHQRFVSSRTPKVTDVLIDSTGAALGILLWELLRRRKRAKKERKARAAGRMDA